MLLSEPCYFRSFSTEEVRQCVSYSRSYTGFCLTMKEE